MFSLRGIRAVGLSITLCGLAVMSSRAQVTNLFSTGFERAQGYDPRFELVGQQDWTTDYAGSGGNGLITNFYASAAAYVGLFDLQPAADSISVWQPVNYQPRSNAPVVRFACAMAIYDSSTTNRDDFFWSVYNMQGNRLFTMDFDNKDLGIYYLLDGTNTWKDSGWSFENDAPESPAVYDLELVMDFAANRWSALLRGMEIITNQPITTTQAPLNFGDVDAVWAVYNRSRPGDNFMVFDDYSIRAEPRAATPPPRGSLKLLGSINGQYLVQVGGAEGAKYAIEASTNMTQWTALRTNMVQGGYFDYRDTASVGLSQRYYRSRFVP